jgi:hypothetical protein
MANTLENFILAVVTTDRESVGGSGPIFFAKDEEDLQTIAFNLEKIMDAMAHEIKPGTIILVRH